MEDQPDDLAPEDQETDSENEESAPKSYKNPPVEVEYCPICKLPAEYCEFAQIPHSQQPRSSSTSSSAPGPVTSESAPAVGPQAPPALEQKGGKKKKVKLPEVHIALKQRQKRKFVTVVVGLDLFGVRLPEAAKAFAKRFSCACSVSKCDIGIGEEIGIQGDVSDELPDILTQQFNVPPGAIIVSEKKEKKK